MRLARGQRERKRLRVRVGHHEDFAASRVLHHARHEPVGVVAHEVEEDLWVDGCVLRTATSWLLAEEFLHDGDAGAGTDTHGAGVDHELDVAERTDAA